MNIDSDRLLELISDDLTFVTSEQEKAYEMGEHGSKMFQLGARKYLEKIRDAIHSGQLDADRPEGNTAAESVAQMVSQSAEMNGEDAFWRHMLRLPVAKFIGPMRNALRNYEAQSADRPECPKCGGSGTEEIKRQCGITEYWPCDCKASK